MTSEEMSMDYIRRTYGVPARRGSRVLYTGGGIDEYGTIISSKGGRLRVRLDLPSLRGKKITYTLHPTWRIEYLTPFCGDEAI